MRAAGLVFVAIGCIALLLAPSSAAETSQDSTENHVNRARGHQQRNRVGAAARNRVPGGIGRATSNPGRQLSARNQIPAGSESLAGPSGLPVRPTTKLSPAALSLGKVQHRSPNPPIVGGPANSTSNIGALNSAPLKRRP